MDQTPKLNPTPEQQTIINGAKVGDSFLVSAGAGSAKTTTLKMLSQELPIRSILGVAFNVKIVEDLTAAMPDRAVVKTLNGLGHGAWAKQRGRFPQVDKQKLARLVSESFKQFAPEVRGLDQDGNCWTALRDFVSQLKHNGYVPDGSVQRPQQTFQVDIEAFLDDFIITHDWDQNAMPVELMLDLADSTLIADIHEGFNGIIDFDDQIYLSTTFFCPYPQFETVLVDEAQDLSRANHVQLLKCKPKQLIAVGDPRQAIYAFRGADTSSMDNLYQRAMAAGLLPSVYPLATSFRCPKLIVERQLRHYPEFRAFATNPDGEVVNKGAWDLAEIPDGAAVICRNNAPLVAMAFSLLVAGRGFQYLGVDMAKNLKSVIKKIAGFSGKTLNRSQEQIPSETVIEQVKAWYLSESLRLTNAGRHDLIGQLADKKACCLIVLRKAKDLGTALALCDSIFTSSSNSVTLVTGHRSKGLEWKDVWHLDPWRVPSKYAKQAAENGSFAQMQQENNLKYVIETRTKFSLTMANFKECRDAQTEVDEE